VIRDIVRAVLVLVVLAVGCEIIAVHRGRQAAAPQPPAWQPAAPAWQPAAPAWQPAAPAWQPAQATPEPGPIRRVAREMVDLTEAFIGVIR
jgi:hypothetical protein